MLLGVWKELTSTRCHHHDEDFVVSSSPPGVPAPAPRRLHASCRVCTTPSEASASRDVMVVVGGKTSLRHIADTLLAHPTDAGASQDAPLSQKLQWERLAASSVDPNLEGRQPHVEADILQPGASSFACPCASAPSSAPLNDACMDYYLGDTAIFDVRESAWLPVLVLLRGSRVSVPVPFDAVDDQLPPIPRAYHSLCGFGHQLVLYGGKSTTQSSKEPRVLDEMWVGSITLTTWGTLRLLPPENASQHVVLPATKAWLTTTAPEHQLVAVLHWTRCTLSAAASERNFNSCYHAATIVTLPLSTHAAVFGQSFELVDDGDGADTSSCPTMVVTGGNTGTVFDNSVRLFDLRYAFAAKRPTAHCQVRRLVTSALPFTSMPGTMSTTASTSSPFVGTQQQCDNCGSRHRFCVHTSTTASTLLKRRKLVASPLTTKTSASNSLPPRDAHTIVPVWRPGESQASIFMFGGEVCMTVFNTLIRLDIGTPGVPHMSHPDAPVDITARWCVVTGGPEFTAAAATKLSASGVKSSPPRSVESEATDDVVPTSNPLQPSTEASQLTQACQERIGLVEKADCVQGYDAKHATTPATTGRANSSDDTVATCVGALDEAGEDFVHNLNPSEGLHPHCEGRGEGKVKTCPRFISISQSPDRGAGARDGTPVGQRGDGFGVAPQHRSFHACWPCGSAGLLIFGGVRQNAPVDDEVLLFDAVTSSWSRVDCGSCHRTPGRRLTCAAVALSGGSSPAWLDDDDLHCRHCTAPMERYMFFGGEDGGENCFNDVWQLQLHYSGCPVALQREQRGGGRLHGVAAATHYDLQQPSDTHYYGAAVLLPTISVSTSSSGNHVLHLTPPPRRRAARDSNDDDDIRAPASPTLHLERAEDEDAPTIKATSEPAFTLLPLKTILGLYVKEHFADTLATKSWS